MGNQQPDQNEINHKPNQDREMRQQVELKDTTSQICIDCTCGFLHPVKSDDKIDTNLGYNATEKEFQFLNESNGRYYFFNDHPYRFGKL